VLAGIWRLRSVLSALLIASIICGVAVVGAAVALKVKGTGALFSNQQPIGVGLGAARIFPGNRVTPAFGVSDHSSGSAADGSSANAFANDGRYFLSRVWATTFASDRYIDLDFNSPLPLGLNASSVAASIRLSSDAGTGTVCMYFELRRASTNALLSSHGSAGSPVACTSGSAASVLNVPLAAASTTDIANDLRVRIFAKDTAGGAMRLDEGTINGQTPYSSWTLYPILTRESYSGQLELLRWGLAGP
jgi:hypothetical protein